MKIELYEGMRGGNYSLPRQTEDFLSRVKRHDAFYTSAKTLYDAQGSVPPKLQKPLDHFILSTVKLEVEAYNDQADAWKGVERNRPIRLICGSGASHIWISREDTKERLAIIYL